MGNRQFQKDGVMVDAYDAAWVTGQIDGPYIDAAIRRFAEHVFSGKPVPKTDWHILDVPSRPSRQEDFEAVRIAARRILTGIPE